ncbi:MAG: BLUF domain-containing protein [Phenylobacterium sp.]|uniref:BLUF domain-containing protein n=1 Tax=Phenylobacterium sp. TaxID=1871053 RepID=UPI0011FECBA0|nr:BLUF domain-containing protein [Phenylobacterium sp.]TAJ71436.1 MAG: BLUF domain-containing protein [Phenylobacterium sp.]
MSAISSSRTLHRLIYSSRQNIHAADLDHEVGSIVRVSIRNNRAASITGLLLVHAGWFLQALEGPAEQVMTTYRRILGDPRNAEARILGAGPAQDREFADWNMCARRMSDADDAILDTLERRELFAPHTLSAASAMRLLKSVRGVQERTQLSASR